MNYLEYKGYLGSVEYSPEDHCLYGKIQFIRDLVNYEAYNVSDLEKEFKISVDQYLDECKKMGKLPNQPLKGSFNVRVGADLHRKAMFKAEEQGLKLNEFVKQSIEKAIASS